MGFGFFVSKSIEPNHRGKFHLRIWVTYTYINKPKIFLIENGRKVREVNNFPSFPMLADRSTLSHTNVNW